MAEPAPPSETRLRKVIIAVLIPVIAIGLLALVPELRRLDPLWKGAIFAAVFLGTILFISRKKRRPPKP